MEPQYSDISTKLKKKGDCTASECWQQPLQHAVLSTARQEPQGEEATNSSTHCVSDSKLHSHALEIATKYSVIHDHAAQSVSAACNYTGSRSSILSSVPYVISSSNAPCTVTASGIYSYNSQIFASNVPKPETTTDVMMKSSNEKENSDNLYSVTGARDTVSSILPDHFSQLSHNSQQAILRQLLGSRSVSTDTTSVKLSSDTLSKDLLQSGLGHPYYNNPAISYAASTSFTTNSHDSGIGVDVRTTHTPTMGERVSGVGAASEQRGCQSSSIVVSLPNHSSSLNMPESPGLPNRNESNASICSSNNTLVIHGSDSPEAPWANKWGTLLQSNRLLTLAYPEAANPVLSRSAVSSQLEGGAAPSSSEGVSSVQPRLSTSSQPEGAALMSTRDRVLSYISGASTDLSDIPLSVLDQSEVLKHLLLGSNSECRASENHIEQRRKGLKTTDNGTKNCLKSSLSVGAADADINLNKTGLSCDITEPNVSNLSVSKLTSKSSSSGSMYSSHLDNVTPTSGYSSASASTNFSTSRSQLAGTDEGVLVRGTDRWRSGVPVLPPPPAYPHWRRDTDVARDALQAAALAREGLATVRGRGMAERDQRRDLSLGPDMGRRGMGVGEAPPPLEGSGDKSSLSRSQPDLARLTSNNNSTYNNTNYTKDATSPKELLLSERLASHELASVVDLLYSENTAMRLDLEVCGRKVSKLLKFESELLRVTTAHEQLVQMCCRREQLEHLARSKLQAQVQALTRANLELREEVEALRSGGASGAAVGGDTEDALRRELNRRDVVMAQLVAQNKELFAGKERLDMEVTAQRQTLHQQRTHIEVLDSALVASQANVARLEEEVRVKQGSVAQLQRAEADRRQQQAEQDMQRRLQREVLLHYHQVRSGGGGSELSTDALQDELRRWEQQQQLPTTQQLQHSDERQQPTVRAASSQPGAPRRDESLGEILL